MRQPPHAAVPLNAKAERQTKERSTELAQQLGTLRALVDAVALPLWLKDRAGCYLTVNDAHARAHGLTVEQMLGQTDDALWPDEIRQTLRTAELLAMSTSQRQSSEIVLPGADGAVWWKIDALPVVDDDGAVTGSAGVAHDIGERKRSERELEDSRSQLRGLIARGEEAREGERKRIAREVHDELGQILTGLQMTVSRLARNAAAQSPALLEPMQEAMELTEKALGAARNVAAALRPAVLDMGIVAALEWLAGRYADKSGVLCQVNVSAEPIDIGESLAVALFRIAQESLTNAARHARASRIDIALDKNSAYCTLRVFDNGVGFDESTRQTHSFGLLGIRERALILGGTVSIGSGPGKGTQIVVSIPCQRIEEKS